MKDLFNQDEPIDQNKEWAKEWEGMPSYNNIKQQPPLITALFKFRSEEDFSRFNELLKQHIYKTNKVFDGMQSKDKKQAWFPLKEKASNYIIE